MILSGLTPNSRIVFISFYISKDEALIFHLCRNWLPSWHSQIPFQALPLFSEGWDPCKPWQRRRASHWEDIDSIAHGASVSDPGQQHRKPHCPTCEPQYNYVAREVKWYIVARTTLNFTSCGKGLVHEQGSCRGIDEVISTTKLLYSCSDRLAIRAW